MLRRLASLRLTVWLLGLMVLLSIPATLILQNQPSSFYQNHFGSPWAGVIRILSYDRYFRSPQWIALLILFWVNLFSCTLLRFTGELKKKKRNFGPDILHTGLLLLLFFGLLSGFIRQEGVYYVEEGSGLELPGGSILILDDFVLELYEDGRPRRYASYVTLTDDKGRISESRVIEVNRPLRIKGLKLYQHSYKRTTSGITATGLLIVKERSAWGIFLSLAVLSLGFALTLIQRSRE